MKKLQPAVQSLVFETSVAAGGTTDVYIDISQCASLVNRRFYRQGLNWAVAGVKFLSATASTLNGTITLQKLPETWVMSNSWEKSFRAWQKMNDEALEESESVRPRFLDFKIYADVAHHAAGFGANLLPINIQGTAVPGEWESSKLLVPVTGPAATDPGQVTEREFIATGPNYPGVGGSGLNAVSIINGYANSRALPDVLDPNTPDDAGDADGGTPENWMSALFNEGTQQTDEVLNVLTDENNIAPYPFENDGVNLDTMYPGGETQLTGLQIHDLEYVTGTTVGGTTRLHGGMFPCGLMGFRLANSGDASISHLIKIDLVPGTHRGYLATPMTEM